MNIKMENSFLASVFLSDVELYFTPPELVKNDRIIIHGEEVHHILKVMRHKPGDDIYITDGKGNIYSGQIIEAGKEDLKAEVKNISRYENQFSNITFCLPRLKNPDRFEFALEKCVELGITNFIIYQAENSVSKGEKLERWNKIVMAAMKQSLRSFLPQVAWKNSIEEILKTGQHVIKLDQNSENPLSSQIILSEEQYLFIFGPEGGFSTREQSLLSDSVSYKLTPNRLRSETAIITAAAILTI